MLVVLLFSSVLLYQGELAAPVFIPSPGIYGQEQHTVGIYSEYPLPIKYCISHLNEDTCRSLGLDSWSTYDSTAQVSFDSSTIICSVLVDDDGVERSERNCAHYWLMKEKELESLAFSMAIEGCEKDNDNYTCTQDLVQLKPTWNDADVSLYYYIEAYHEPSRPVGLGDTSASMRTGMNGALIPPVIEIDFSSSEYLAHESFVFKAQFFSSSSRYSPLIEYVFDISPSLPEPTITTRITESGTYYKIECTDISVCVVLVEDAADNNPDNVAAKLISQGTAAPMGETLLPPGRFIIATRALPSIKTKASKPVTLEIASEYHIDPPSVFYCPNSTSVADTKKCVRASIGCTPIVTTIPSKLLLLQYPKPTRLPNDTLMSVNGTQQTIDELPLLIEGSKISFAVGDDYIITKACDITFNTIPTIETPNASVTNSTTPGLYSRWKECGHMLPYHLSPPAELSDKSEICFSFDKKITDIYILYSLLDIPYCGTSTPLAKGEHISTSCDFEFQHCGTKDSFLQGLHRDTIHYQVDTSGDYCIPNDFSKEGLYYVEYVAVCDTVVSFIGELSFLHENTKIVTTTAETRTYKTQEEKIEEEGVNLQTMKDKTFLKWYGENKITYSLIQYLSESFAKLFSNDKPLNEFLTEKGQYWENTMMFTTLILWLIVALILVALLVLVVLGIVRLSKMCCLSRKLRGTGRFDTRCVFCLTRRKMSKNKA